MQEIASNQGETPTTRIVQKIAPLLMRSSEASPLAGLRPRPCGRRNSSVRVLERGAAQRWRAGCYKLRRYKEGNGGDTAHTGVPVCWDRAAQESALSILLLQLCQHGIDRVAHDRLAPLGARRHLLVKDLAMPRLFRLDTGAESAGSFSSGSRRTLCNSLAPVHLFNFLSALLCLGKLRLLFVLHTVSHGV